MVRIDKVHTGGGDNGETSLLSGARVQKNHPRVELYGSIDELNSIIGLVRSELNRLTDTHQDGGPRATVRKVQSEVDPKLKIIQQELFDIGGECACPPKDLPEAMGTIGMEQADRLCSEMDVWLSETEPLESFILPAGSPLVATTHVARSTARRVERIAISLRETDGEESVRPTVIAYLNRLSDWLFVLARWTMSILGEEETLWIPFSKRTED